MSTDESLPNDDVQSDGRSEAELLDAVMRNSPIMEEAGAVPPPPEEVEDADDPVDSEEDSPDSEDIDNEDDVGEEEEEAVDADEDAGDEPATQEDEVYTSDDLDLDAQVLVKIDGEEHKVSFGDLMKGYTTDQSLSKKGRELGEERKKLETERIEKLGQLEQVAQAGAAILMQPEQKAQKEYHDLEAKIKEARENGDTYELGELKDLREQAQQAYWTARRNREGLLQSVEKQKMEVAEQQWAQQIEHFNSSIPDMIPDFSPEVATSIREFAIGEGIDPAILDTITDPSIVKFVDDYRRLKQGVRKGKAKRKAAAVKKVPAKKSTPKSVKQKQKSESLRKKVLSGQGTKQDEDDFLKNFAMNSLSKF